jgi:ABC-type branched-subunit amino acid transport system substrate-binding protein
MVAALLSSCGLIEDALGEDEAGPQTGEVVVLLAGGPAGARVNEGVVDAVEQAVADAAGEIADWDVVVVPVEDDRDAQSMRDIAEEIADGDAVAVIGGLSTSTIRTAQPIFDQASLLFVSPADVDPAHTRGADPADPLRPYGTYYRTAVPGGDGLETLARYAVKGRQAAEVAVVDAGDKSVADRFTRAVRSLGATVSVAGSAADAQAVSTLVDAAREAEADAVFVSGDAEPAAAVVREIADSDLDAEVFVAPGLASPEFVDAAGTGSDGVVSVRAAELDDSADVELPAVGDAGRYAAAAFDAGTAVGTVLARCLPSASTPSAARQGCVSEMSEVTFAGVTGDVEFDAHGDRVGGSPELLVVRGGEWASVGAD